MKQAPVRWHRRYFPALRRGAFGSETGTQPIRQMTRPSAIKGV